MSSIAKRRRCFPASVEVPKNDCSAVPEVSDTSEHYYKIFMRNSHRKATQEETKVGEKGTRGTNKGIRETEPVLEQNPDDSGLVAFFDMLPNETLAYIFSYLNIRERAIIEAVCKRWYDVGRNILCSPSILVLDPTLPETLKKNAMLTDENLEKLLSRFGKNIKHLTLGKYEGFTEKAVGLVGKYCPNVVELSLCRLSLYSVYLQKLAKGCQNLKSITIQEASVLRGLSRFLKQFSNLEVFDLSKEGSSSSLKNGEFCLGLNKNLQIFRVTECRYLNPCIVLIHLVNQCNSLQEFRLDFAWRNTFFHWQQLSNAVYMAYQPEESLFVEFFDHFKHTMKVVSLYGVLGNGEIDWRRSICILYNLEELWLESCHCVNVDFIKCLAERCVKLKLLNLASARSVNDECLANLASLPCLIILDVSYSFIDGSGLEVLASQGRLKEVYARGCYCLQEESLCSLAISCPNLCLLDASGVKTATQNLLKTFWLCIKNGFLLPPVQLVVTATSVVYAEYKYAGLEILFNNTLNESKCYGQPYKFSQTQNKQGL